MPPELREAAKARAAQQGRSLSNYLIQLARQDLRSTIKRKTEKQGKLTKKGARNGQKTPERSLVSSGHSF
jgi:hypothetical protein